MSTARRGRARWAWRSAISLMLLAGCATGGADYELGQTLAGQRKWDEAIRALQAAIQQEPDNPEYKAALAKVRAAAADEQLRAATAVAATMSQLADVDRGLAAVERALSYDRGHAPSRELQATLRERRTALLAEIDRLLAEGKGFIQAREWAKGDQAAGRVLAIDPANVAAAQLRQEAQRGAVETILKRAVDAEAAGDWRQAVRALEEALGRDPANAELRRRLKTAQERDSLAYYVGRAEEREARKEFDAAYGFLTQAAKYWSGDVRLLDAMARVAREGRRRYYTEALQRAENDDWGRVHAQLSRARDVYGPASSVDPQLRGLVRDLSTKLYDWASEFENQKLWGNMFLWFQTVQGVDPLYRDTAAKVEQTREKLNDRATVKIAVLELEPPKSAPDAGSIVSGSIVTNLFRLGRRDFRVVERQALQSIIKEISIGQAGMLDVETAKEIGKIAGIDAILVGRVLQYKVDQNESEGLKRVSVQVGSRSVPNPAYDRYLTDVREGRKRATDPPPPVTIQEPQHQLVTYRIGTVTAIGYVSVSFRLVGVERGEIRLAEKIDEQETFRKEYSEGVEAAGIQAVPKTAPIPTEVLNRVTEEAVGKVVGLVGRHFANRQEEFLNAGREFERRRQFTRAIEEYMNCVTSAELQRTGERFALAAQKQVDQLLRQ